MGALLKVCVALALLWSGWWWLAAGVIERQLSDVAVNAPDAGWQADLGDLQVAGFPGVFNTHIGRITVQHPDTGLSVKADDVRAVMPAYWPGDITLDLPQTPVEISGPAGTLFLRSSDGRAALETYPSFATELERLSVSAASWDANTPQGNLISGKGLLAELRHLPEERHSYRATLTATELIPGDLLRGLLAIPSVWPERFEAFAATADITFDKPLDRFAGQAPHPQPRSVRLETLDLRWYEVAIGGSGMLTFDADGVPEGEVRLVIERWAVLLAQLERARLLPAARARQVEVVANALANLSGGSETLDLQLRFEAGNAFLGPIALGPAPKIKIRY